MFLLKINKWCWGNKHEEECDYRVNDAIAMDIISNWQVKH